MREGWRCYVGGATAAAVLYLGFAMPSCHEPGPVGDTPSEDVDASIETDGGGATCSSDVECVDQGACRIGTCDLATSTCSYATAPDSCYIDGVCYDRGDAQTGALCNVCDPDVSVDGFTPLACPQGSVCEPATGECALVVTGATLCGPCATSDDCEAGLTCQSVGTGMHCTRTCAVDSDCGIGFACRAIAGADVCVLAGGACAGPGSPCDVSGQCDDLNPCTIGTCDGNSCSFSDDDTATEACYTADPATRGVGICSDGVRSCSGGVLGDCLDEVPPEPQDVCGDTLDNDCDGAVDQECNILGVDLAPMNAALTGPLSAQSGDIVHITLDATPVGPPSPSDAPLRVDLGFYPPEY